jgi:putative nucleotidyltransferase with HDIG domain
VTDSNRKLETIALVVDQFEGYRNPHATRIAAIADSLARRAGIGEQDRSFLRTAALLHDLGESVMNRDYIKSNRALTEPERLDLMRHPVLGEQEAAKRGLPRAVQLLIRWHHEWWNGDGYPDAISGRAIPLGARILRLADTYCAITDSRPHSQAISAEEARSYLRQWAGIEFDPDLTALFLEIEHLPELTAFAAPASVNLPAEMTEESEISQISN